MVVERVKWGNAGRGKEWVFQRRGGAVEVALSEGERVSVVFARCL